MSDDDAPGGEAPAETYPCPKCPDQQLNELEERSIYFLGCTVCYGLFVTPRDLHDYVIKATDRAPIGDAFTTLFDAALAGNVTPGKRKCPCCDDSMDRFGFGESPFVILDICTEHGLWLDKKELTKVVRASRGQAVSSGLIGKDEVFDHDDEDDDDEGY